MKKVQSLIFAIVLLVAVATPASAAGGYPTCYVANAAQLSDASVVDFYFGPGTIERCRADRGDMNAAEDRAGRSNKYYLFDTTRYTQATRGPQNWYLGCTFDTNAGGGYQVLVNPSRYGYEAYSQQVCDATRKYSDTLGIAERDNPTGS